MTDAILKRGHARNQSEKDTNSNSVTVGARQDSYPVRFASGRFWQRFAVLVPEQAKLPVLKQAANVEDILRSGNTPIQVPALT
jgi:hypothetical protein